METVPTKDGTALDPGRRTSEFVVTALLPFVTAAITKLEALPLEMQKWLIAAATVGVVAFIASRTWVKVTEIKARVDRQ